ncbi:Glucooligosaccharide oxidase [Macroventuria anomochaeta]|uniref:Glucooligosaccharide oxidase n=1 Tax=Macroventuria anomochaeta TaxID=301207 RepID=A0ACB6SFC3_9PLEO|nr:Glucooligosaccharide oxidase [Macroventuria anomochaeta]KAF2632033.1 Glucooligosaccharide oxidase [Macroventuria anomochaeta]
MGNTSSSPVQKCLESAVGGNQDLIALKGTPLFQISHVKPCNLGIAVTPAAVTYSETVEHITAIVKCAVENKLKCNRISVGTHMQTMYNTIVVDVKYFQQFSMDNSTWQATIGGGTLLGDVGIGGHATISELDRSSRMWGSALDHVEEVKVVLANSTVVRASEKENADILFAVKGAAAGFGIVTEFKVRTQTEPSEAVLYTYNTQGGSSAELISDPHLSRKFASQFILTEQLGAIVTGTFFGSHQEYDSLNISARLPNSDDSVIKLKDWFGVVGHWAEDVALDISLVYTEYDIIPDDGVDKLFDYIDKADKVEATWFIIWDLEGGVTNDVAPNATAYDHRNALVRNKTRRFWTVVNDAVTDALPEHDEGPYTGYVNLRIGENRASLYWSGTVKILEGIKAQVNPDDVFHNPQSIKPARGSAKPRAKP